MADNDSYTSGHGPLEGGSHFLYLYGKLGKDGDYAEEQGRAFSPQYIQASTECTLYLYYYINGDTGDLIDVDGQKSALGKPQYYRFCDRLHLGRVECTSAETLDSDDKRV